MVTKRTTRTEELVKKDVAHFFHLLATVGQAPKIIWEGGKGAQLWDTDGNKYIDMASSGAHCVHLGYGRKELNDAAWEQIQKVSFVFSAYPMSNIPAIEYAAELAEVLPGDINHVFFTTCGTESNEVAIQIVRFYREAHGQESKHKIISLMRSYHGGSALVRSLSGIGMTAHFGRPYPGIVRIPNYHCYRCPFDLKYPTCNITCARFLEKVIAEEGEETITAFIGEPVQGPAGIVWPPDEYWPIVRRICSDHDILLISDCVQTGFCRTGKFWGVDNWNIVPDILTMGKGINSNYLPMGAVGVSDRIYKDLSGKSYRGGATSDANPACAATARAALKVYKGEKLAERATKLGEHIHERLVKEFLPLPCVDDVMGRGLYQSFEISLNKTTGSKFNLGAVAEAKERIFSQCLEKGVLITQVDGFPRRQCIVPPLVIGDDELDRALDVMLGAMKAVSPV